MKTVLVTGNDVALAKTVLVNANDVALARSVLVNANEVAGQEAQGTLIARD